MNDSSKIYDAAIRLLTRREHSKFDLIRKLRSRGFESESINNVIQLLSKKMLQSDERFIDNYVRMRVRLGFGYIKIYKELLGHCVDSNLIRSYLDEYKNKWDYLAEAARTKRFGKLKPSNYKEWSKQMRFLQYRGFKIDNFNLYNPNIA